MPGRTSSEPGREQYVCDISGLVNEGWSGGVQQKRARAMVAAVTMTCV